MTRKLVDPVHFFDSRGNAMLTNEHLLERNRVLEAQVEKLKRLLEAQVKRNRALLEEQIAPTTH